MACPALSDPAQRKRSESRAGISVDIEILRCDDFSVRGGKMIDAMCAAVPGWARAHISNRWTGRHDVLMTYGLGHLHRRHWTAEHQAKGGRLIGWDLGYWSRDVAGEFNMRLTIDADHPHAMIVPESPERFDSQNVTLREDADPDGPIVLCGLGNKQRRWKGFGRWEWEQNALRKIRKHYPGRKVVYRPKRPEDAPGGLSTRKGSIEDALKGASLVVCLHSNVAVDACIAGVPVQCEDGAALALYGKTQAPTREERLGFLRSLAWWNWSPQETPQAWEFIRRKLE